MKEVIGLKSNKEIKGRPVFSEESQIRKKSLKLYSYLVCRAYLRNIPKKGIPNVRIFQQKDIVLSHIGKLFKMDERTIKKCWEELEDEGLVRFTPTTWKEEKYIFDEDGNRTKVSFNERWKIRRKHKESYYEMPIEDGQLFRKIPKETLTELNERYNVGELTLKVYMTLVNYQELCNTNGEQIKFFTYKDLRDILGYALEATTDRKLEDCLRILQSLGLIVIECTNYINKYGNKVDCFLLSEVDFWIHYDIKDFDTTNENAINEENKEELINKNKELYPEAFK